MPPQIPSPNRRIPVEHLTPAAFASFGTVVQNPSHAPSTAGFQSLQAVQANQGSALKYLDVTHLDNHYNLAPSRKPAKAVMNMFVCSPRTLEAADGTASQPAEQSGSADSDMGGAVRMVKKKFPVRILERHPYTPQTFIPLGLAPDDHSTTYLVVVAPTLPASSKENGAKDRQPPYPVQAPQRRRSIKDIFLRMRPSPFTNTHDTPPSSHATGGKSGPAPKGPGYPDLSQVRAFIANGTQAVTYGPGTWHAPMVVLGAKSIDFVVVQYANGVGLEDCQEVEFKPEGGAEGINVVIDDGAFDQNMFHRAKL